MNITRTLIVTITLVTLAQSVEAACVVPSSVLRPGMRDGKKDNNVALMQAFLKERFGTGIVNGYFGVQTKNALIRFQKEMKLPQTGVLGPQTIKAMKASCGVSSGGSNGGKPTTPPASCKVWYDGCNTCSRDSIGGEFRCTMRACLDQSISEPSCKASFTTAMNPIKPNTNEKDAEPMCPVTKSYVCGTPHNCLITIDGSTALPRECTHGKTYQNRCMLDAAQALFLHNGMCEQ